MATENTEPKSALILKITTLSVATLLGARFFLVSYFNVETDEELYRKVASVKSQQLLALREQERKDLFGGPLPIDKAMALYAMHPREMAGSTLAPEQSTDTAAMTGWMQRPRPAPEAPLVQQVPTPAADADGGAAPLAADAGVPPVAPTQVPPQAPAPQAPAPVPPKAPAPPTSAPAPAPAPSQPTPDAPKKTP